MQKPEVAFLLACSPEPLSIDEAVHFHERLTRAKLSIGGCIVNRVHSHAAKCRRTCCQFCRPALSYRVLRPTIWLPWPMSFREPMPNSGRWLLRTKRRFDGSAKTAAAVADSAAGTRCPRCRQHGRGQSSPDSLAR